MSAPAGPIAVYGATGYTGRLVARELSRRGLPFVLSGRDPARLRSVAASVGRPEIRVASVGDRDALRHAFGDCAVVINCAGPFTKFGEAVVRAAVETGTHYLDTTGEQPYMKLILDRYDEAARAAEVAVLPAMGFDYVPGDLLCRVVARDVEPLSELDVAYVVAGFGATRGTLRSTLEAMKGGDVVWEDGAWRPAGPGPLRSRVRFPAPFGDQVVAKYPCGEIITVPGHTRVRTIKARISVQTMAPLGPFAFALPPAMAALGPLLRTPVRGAMQTAIGALPEGPDENERESARFMIVVRANGEDGRTRGGVVRGNDVYGLTAVTTVHGAVLLAAPDFAGAGVHGPAGVFDPVAFLNYLTDHGLAWETS